MRLFELKLTQLAALLFVQSRKTGGVTCTDLARELRVSTAAITGMKDRLVSAGFMEEKANPSDRRQTIITLTASGVKACDEFAAMDLSSPFDALSKFLNSDN